MNDRLDKYLKLLLKFENQQGGSNRREKEVPPYQRVESDDAKRKLVK